jgi:hypothetical protein
MAERKISELPVIDGRGRPCGIIDITDVVALFPEARLAESPPRGNNSHTVPQSRESEAPLVARFPAARQPARKLSPRQARPRDCA